MSEYSHFEVYPYWDYIDLTDSEFGLPNIEGTTLRVPVRQLEVIAGFPGYEQSLLYSECTLVFNGITSSIRKVKKYDLARKEFEAGNIIDDGPFPESQAQLYRFSLGDWSYALNASLSWKIVAESVHIENGIIKPYKNPS